MTKKECAALLFFAALIYPHFALCGDGRANNNFNNFRYYPDSTMFPFYTDPNASYHACNHCGFVHVPLPAYSPPPPMPRQNLPIGVAVQPSNTLPVPDPKKNESLKRPREEAGQDNTSESDKAAKRKKRNEEDTVSDSEEEETAFVGDDSDDGDDGEKEPKIREREYPEIVVLKENELKPNDIFSWAYWWENRRDYGQAKRHYEKAISSSTSREPDARAHFKLAEHHEKGTCRIRKDPREARKHYKLAAEGGCSEAQFKLGLYYEYGQCGFPKNIKRAIFWYEKAAKNSNRSLGALVNLGILNENGIDGKINAKKAAEYYKEAADNGSCDGQYRLSSC
ncbi:MAG TPA: tetratricopeptide repeat protein, partial [Myxococcota bacterium]|nr:tetratricopeptide repeat protein [Myxococcota bacterium]